MNQKLNKIPTNKKHIIKHIIREKCTKIGCCADIDHRIKTHKINKNDITYGNIILSKDMFNLLRTHVKTDTSQQISQQIEQFQRFVFMSNFPLSFSLRCRHCSLDIKSKYIYSNIISNCWFLSYGSKCMSSMILSNSRLDKSRFYIDDKYTYYKNLIKIKISLTLLEVLNVDLIHLKCDNKNINIRIDAFNAIRGLYIEYQKRDEGIFIKNINKNNKIEELIGLHSNDIFNITPDKFKF